MNVTTASPPPLRIAWFIWSLGAFFYLLGFFHRVAPAVMTEELMREFDISAGALGQLSAFYFYSYVAMQIPTGIIADTWGPRRLLSTGAWVATVGTILFALSPAMFWVGMGRLLIGGSVAVAFVGLLKLANSWFPPRYYAMVSGMALFFGIIGAVFAGNPLRLLMDHYSWRTVMLFVAVLSVAIGIAIRLFVRDYPHEKGYADLATCGIGCSETRRTPIVAGILEVCRNRNTLLLLVIPGSLAGSVLTFCGLWGVPYLVTHHDLSTSRAAVVTSAVLVALALAGPIFGWLSDRWGKRKPLFIIGCALTLTAFTIAFFATALPLTALVVLLLIAGFSSGSMILTFAFAKESVPGRLSGTVSGVINMGVMIGPMVLQPAVGWMLDRQWQGQTQAGVRIYNLAAYQAGFSMMLAWIALALILLFFTRETHCRQTV
ncbi:MFS transporter [Desulfatitalea tepidiphila]|uniref:MFS transporter n=1 Tax=Desulfatitalea tepidiphila TaxID=1185843 RepID=UPI0006B5D1EA|nr:MFS transporter [Desulfatitalea tepidiphila]